MKRTFIFCASAVIALACTVQAGVATFGILGRGTIITLLIRRWQRS